MIITLKGKIIYKEARFIILENNNIGYKIYLNNLDNINLENDIKLFIHEHIREDRHDLYGFLTYENLSFFSKLLSVSGVGPKMAQNICSLGMEKIEKSIMEGNTASIESVSGVGKKTAQKIVLELKGAIDKILTKKDINQDVLNALVGLGYNRKYVVEVLESLEEKISGEKAQIKAALKVLSNKS